jgi:hypothetical protein
LATPGYGDHKQGTKPPMVTQIGQSQGDWCGLECSPSSGVKPWLTWTETLLLGSPDEVTLLIYAKAPYRPVESLAYTLCACVFMTPYGNVCSSRWWLWSRGRWVLKVCGYFLKDVLRSLDLLKLPSLGFCYIQLLLLITYFLFLFALTLASSSLDLSSLLRLWQPCLGHTLCSINYNYY